MAMMKNNGIEITRRRKLHRISSNLFK